MLISREQAAVDLDVSFSTICRWVKTGELVARRVGPRATYIDTDASPAYVQKFASLKATPGGARKLAVSA